MPFGEIETHPYLHMQVNLSNANVERSNQLLKYKSLVVGTFPIYALTSSIPIAPEGVNRRLTWLNYASIQYFYGSAGNHFHELFAHSFNANAGALNTPNNVITLLDSKKNFL